MFRTIPRYLTIALVATGCVAAQTLLPTSSQAGPNVAADPAVITTWNGITARTLAENAVPIPTSGLYYGFVAVAVYDAVVTIEGGYEPYSAQPRAHAFASSEVAAATAAYRVLSHYFPASAGKLAVDYETSLAGARTDDDVGMVHGKRVGEAAAASIIQSRQDDGRGATVPPALAVAPGVWRPTPDAFAPMLAPWLGFVRPLVLASPKQFPLPGPDALGTEAYARDFAEVKTYGAKDGSARTAAQTETALFFNFAAVLQYQMGLRDQVTRRDLDIRESARAFALLDTSIADAFIACWRAKYDYAYWRPVTAIRFADTDGNSATEPDPGWTPLVPTPPYPDYTSGHACITGAASNTFDYLFGDGPLDLDLYSDVTKTTRHYDTAAALDEETMNARIWLGLHFRKAMTDGNRLGHQVSAWTIGRQFQPTD